MARCETRGMPGFDRITFDPGVKGGRACIRGQRVTVSLILNLVANDMDVDEIIEAYHYLEREDVHQALRYGAWPAEENICEFESMTEEKKTELDRRLEAHQQNPEEAISGDAVLKKIGGRRGAGNDN